MCQTEQLMVKLDCDWFRVGVPSLFFTRLALDLLQRVNVMVEECALSLDDKPSLPAGNCGAPTTREPRLAVVQSNGSAQIHDNSHAISSHTSPLPHLPLLPVVACGDA